MRFGKQVSIGFKGYFKAINLLFSKGFIKYMIFPLLLNILIFWLGLSLVIDAAGWASDAFANWINISDGSFWGSETLKGFTSGFIKTIVYVMFLVSFVFFGGFVIIIIMSPLFSIISEKTEYVLTEGGIDYPFELKQFLIDVFRGVGIAIRNMALEMGILIIVFIAGIILSFISWLGVIFMFFVSAYFYGFSYMDYTNERHKRNLKTSVKFIRKYKWVAIVNGSLFAFVLFIPWLGVALSAFVSVISVIAATVSMLEIKKIEDAEIDRMFNAEV